MSDILIVDDHPLFAEALKSILLAAYADMKVKCIDTFSAAINYVNDQPIPPQLILLDLNLPDSPASNSLERFTNEFADIKVAIISAADEPLRIRQAISSGALGFISKAQQPSEIIDAIHDLLQGKTVVPAQQLLSNLDPATPLSNRQVEVMHVMAAGLSNKEIAQKLGMSPGTVKVHLRDIFSRLGVNNRTQAIAVFNSKYC